MGLARVQFSEELVVQMLCFPPGTHIVSFVLTHADAGGTEGRILDCIVDSPELPSISEGEIPTVTYILHRDEQSGLFSRWEP